MEYLISMKLKQHIKALGCILQLFVACLSMFYVYNYDDIHNIAKNNRYY